MNSTQRHKKFFKLQFTNNEYVIESCACWVAIVFTVCFFSNTNQNLKITFDFSYIYIKFIEVENYVDFIVAT